MKGKWALRAEAGDTEGLTIQRFHRLCQDAVREFGLPCEIHPPNHPSDLYWNEEMPQALLDAEDAGLEKFDAIVVDDAVTTRAAIFGAMNFDEPGSILGITGGALGWGMGGTMGVKLANPDRPVVGIIGDGSARMTGQALWTAANADSRVVYVINKSLMYMLSRSNFYTAVTRAKDNVHVIADMRSIQVSVTRTSNQR